MCYRHTVQPEDESLMRRWAMGVDESFHTTSGARRRRRVAHKFPPDSPTPDTRRPRRTTLRRAIVSYWGFHTVRRAPHGPTSSFGFATGE
ncbi:hypothetical protein J6590_093484 [Homalodisca vitripennis]|nr:hypothetical protein J6590_097223 [Homalodisca vitripennis]KAG8270063.1 hypothetical protein J6590_093484 [Homalodisca vitripennis]